MARFTSILWQPYGLAEIDSEIDAEKNSILYDYQLQFRWKKTQLKPFYVSSCIKSLNFKHIMAVVVKTVNSMSGGLNHRQFQEFLKQTEAEHSDLTYFSNIQWLSCDKMPECIHAWRRHFDVFREQRQRNYFQDQQWFVRLTFLVDITNHMNTLNAEPRGKKTVVFVVIGQTTAFERRLSLWESQRKKETTFIFQVSKITRYNIRHFFELH